MVLEPRVDNEKYVLFLFPLLFILFLDLLLMWCRLAQYLMDVGFYKEREVSFPHKQSNLMRIQRDAWEGPVL